MAIGGVEAKSMFHDLRERVAGKFPDDSLKIAYGIGAKPFPGKQRLVTAAKYRDDLPKRQRAHRKGVSRRPV